MAQNYQETRKYLDQDERENQCIKICIIQQSSPWREMYVSLKMYTRKEKQSKIKGPKFYMLKARKKHI